jgi:hypothetical protein
LEPAACAGPAVAETSRGNREDTVDVRLEDSIVV